MKKLSINAVAEALKKYQSLEAATDHVDYYLHVKSDGTLASSSYEADETFIYSVDIEKYGFSLDQWENEDCLEEVYDHEITGDPIFDEVVENLTAQANEWLCEA